MLFKSLFDRPRVLFTVDVDSWWHLVPGKCCGHTYRLADCFCTLRGKGCRSLLVSKPRLDAMIWAMCHGNVGKFAGAGWHGCLATFHGECGWEDSPDVRDARKIPTMQVGHWGS